MKFELSYSSSNNHGSVEKWTSKISSFPLLDNDASKATLVRSIIEMLIISMIDLLKKAQGMKIKANPFPYSKLNNFLISPQN